MRSPSAWNSWLDKQGYEGLEEYQGLEVKGEKRKSETNSQNSKPIACVVCR